jgi:hypothetical protein
MRSTVSSETIKFEIYLVAKIHAVIYKVSILRVKVIMEH